MTEAGLPYRRGEGREAPSIREQLNRVEHFQTVADVFKQLDDTTRIRIFWLLCHCEECVLNISSLLEMSSPAVSHHLRPLKNSGLIVSRRVGKEVYYRALESGRAQLLHRFIEELIQCICPGTAPSGGNPAGKEETAHDR